MARRAKRRHRGIRVYSDGIRKLWLAQRPNRDEARELKKQRLVDGSFPLPKLLVKVAQP